MHAVAWLAFSLVATALAQVAFKFYFKRRNIGWILLAVTMFAAVPYTTYMALRGLSLSTVYVATAASQMLVVMLSMVLLGERYTSRQAAGFVLILAGIALFNLDAIWR